MDTARFWASRAVRRWMAAYSPRHRAGPSTTQDVDHNAFANVLARWQIARALEPVENYQRVGPMKPARLDRSWRLATTCLRTGANE